MCDIQNPPALIAGGKQGVWGIRKDLEVNLRISIGLHVLSLKVLYHSFQLYALVGVFTRSLMIGALRVT